jgi:hypothetical protein
MKTLESEIKSNSIYNSIKTTGYFNLAKHTCKVCTSKLVHPAESY